jgi:hypothetical protein
VTLPVNSCKVLLAYPALFAVTVSYVAIFLPDFGSCVFAPYLVVLFASLVWTTTAEVFNAPFFPVSEEKIRISNEERHPSVVEVTWDDPRCYRPYRHGFTPSLFPRNARKKNVTTNHHTATRSKNSSNENMEPIIATPVLIGSPQPASDWQKILEARSQSAAQAPTCLINYGTALV